jgi:putative hydrolase of the HAD superfamily
MKLKAIFFDLDNTLCNWSHGWESAREHGSRAAFQVLQTRFPRIGFAEWHEAFNEVTEEIAYFWQQPIQQGVSVGRERSRRVLTRLGIDVEEAFIDSLTQAFYEAVLEQLRIYPDADKALRVLRPSFTLGIITNGPGDIQRAKVERLGLPQRVDHVLISGELGIAKPDPKIFQMALELAEAEPEGFLFVGDSLETDIVGAKGAGVWAAWIDRGRLSPKEDPEADFVLGSLVELIDVVDLPTQLR